MAFREHQPGFARQKRITGRVPCQPQKQNSRRPPEADGGAVIVSILYIIPPCRPFHPCRRHTAALFSLREVGDDGLSREEHAGR